MYTNLGVSEKQIRLDLAREAATADKAAAGEGGDNDDDEYGVEDDARGLHPSLFVPQGVQLEEGQ
jgi:hypothetical protein